MGVAKIKEFGLAVGDLGKVYPITIKNTDGNAVDLTSADITLQYETYRQCDANNR